MEIGEQIETVLKRRAVAHPAAWSLLWAAILEENPDAMTWLTAALNGRSLHCEQLSLGFEDVDPRTDAPANLLATLSRCSTLAEAATELRVCRATIQRWLNKSGSLRAEWARLRNEERHRRALENIRAYLRIAPHTNRAQLLRQCASDVAWLQRHDWNSLQRQLESIPSGRTPQRQLWPAANFE